MAVFEGDIANDFDEALTALFGESVKGLSRRSRGQGGEYAGWRERDCRVSADDGVDAPILGHHTEARKEEPMEQVHIIGIDLAKQSFQLHGARADGSVGKSWQGEDARLSGVTTALPGGDGGARARTGIGRLGHEVKGRRFVLRHKNDATAICGLPPARRSPRLKIRVRDWRSANWARFGEIARGARATGAEYAGWTETPRCARVYLWADGISTG